MFYPHHELRVRVSLYFCIPESNQSKVVDESNIFIEFTTLIGDQKFKIPLEELYQDHKRPSFTQFCSNHKIYQLLSMQGAVGGYGSLLQEWYFWSCYLRAPYTIQGENSEVVFYLNFC